MPHEFDRRQIAAALAGAPLLAGVPLLGTTTGASGQAAPPATTPPPAQPTPAPSFRLEDVVDRARRLAAEPFREAAGALPEELARLDYDAYRDIRFRPDRALLGDANSRFRLQLFHLGFLFQRPVTVNIVNHGIAAPIPYSASLFDYGKNRFERPLPVGLGFAGFRLHYPLNRPDMLDELAVFLGASYFRFLSRGQRYGLSARGLAIGSGEPDEEFPFFREFWVEQPAKADEFVVVHALLDGASTTGAYHFVIRPGQDSMVETKATLFPRRSMARVGFAPLTSMFFTSENDRRVRDDFRDEIHDSDGLLIHTGGGEWIWRPLANPPRPRVSQFGDRNPRGFGLLQRDRNFARYEDLEARYDLRPSYWVAPQGDWGEGAVHLVELNTPDETNDNIVAFWRPTRAPEPGTPIELTYVIRAIGQLDLHEGGKATGSFQTAFVPPPSAPHLAKRRFMIDFTRGDLAFYLDTPRRMELAVQATDGRVVRQVLEPNPVTRGFRAYLDVEADKGARVEMRAALVVDGHPLTETWAFAWDAPT